MPPPWKDLGSFQGFSSPVSARSVSLRIGCRSSCLEMGFGAAYIRAARWERASAHFRLDADGCRAPRNEEVKSMDRHSRVLAGGCLVVLMGIVLTASGCRSMRNDVPPGKPYSTTGGGLPRSASTPTLTPIPRSRLAFMAALAPAPADAGPAGAGAPTQFGTPPPNASPYGAPSSNRYGPIPGNVAPPPLNQ